MISAAVYSLLLSLAADISSSHPADYVYQGKSQCYFRNGTEDIQFLDRYIYNQEEYVYFDSDVGHYMAKTDYGRPTAEAWNNDPDILAKERAYKETLCKYNYEIFKPLTIDKRSEPRVKILYVPAESSEHEHTLTCYVDNFFPSLINVTWLKNGVKESDRVISTELLNNGDWTFQIHVLLETTIEHGDTFTCRVEHSSLKTPKEVDWRFETSESARSKKLTGIVGFVLGAVFFLIGLIVYIRNRKDVTFLPVQQNNPMS